MGDASARQSEPAVATADAQGVAVSAIVLAYRKEEVLHRSLGALKAALERVEAPTEMIVVVNDLAPKARVGLRSRFPAATLVEPKRNLGFAGGVETARARARGEWIALVNDDAVVAPDALARLLTTARSRPDVGAVAAQIRFEGPRAVVNSAGIDVDVLGVATERLLGSRPRKNERKPVDVFGASGAAALYRRATLDAVGGFDSTFFAYLEDADLAWRAQMQGWRCLYEPRALVEHQHSATLGHASLEKHFLVGRNRVRMLAKNATTEQLRTHLPEIIAYDLAYVLFAAIRHRTLAPLRGRVAGLREWRRYRAAGASRRRSIPLSPAAGLAAAVRRNRSYAEGGA